MRSTRPYVLALCSLSCLGLLAASAGARAQELPRDDFSAHRFYVAPGPSNFLMVEGGDTGPDLQPTFGATLGYAHRPFAADDLDCVTGQTRAGCDDGDVVETDLLASLLTLQLRASLTFLERVQVGLNLPVFLFFDGERYTYVERFGDRDLTTRTAAPGGAGGGLGDPRLSAKIRILDPDHRGEGFVLAASAWVTVPIGHYMWENHFLGDRLPQLGAQAIAGIAFEGFRLAVNLGGVLREEQTNLRSSVGSELVWGVAGAYRFHPLFEALVELTGATSFGLRFDSEAPTELRAAMQLFAGDFTFTAGAGAGLVYGIGVPVFRAFGGVAYVPQPERDTDADGLLDSVDACPTEAEDGDGFEDEDGCPEADNDQDGIEDGEDGCPDEAEDVDDFEDEDGCPDSDDDGDGIADGYDSCPRVPEDVDGDRDQDGCPDHDRDSDGIEDAQDQCPDEPEDFDGFGDTDGCPEEDFDGDGVPDLEDDCPEEPDGGRGRRGRGGCP